MIVRPNGPYRTKLKHTIMQENLIIESSWIKIFNILRQNKYVYVKNQERTKLFLKAICWIARNGTRWRSLPEEFGKWNTVFKRFNQWTSNKVWNFIFESCIEDPDKDHVMIDSTIVRAHSSAAGYRYKIPEGIGRSRGGLTTKIHAIVDAIGLSLNFLITAGNVSDIKMAIPLIQSTYSTQVLADKGYDSDAFRAHLHLKSCVPVIPGRSNRKIAIEYDEILYKERNYIERFFSRIKHFRRIATRYEKTVRNYMAFLKLVGALSWLQ